MYAGQKVDVGLHHADFQNVGPFLPCHGPEESAEKSGEGGVDERGVEDRCVAKPRRAEQRFNHEGT